MENLKSPLLELLQELEVTLMEHWSLSQRVEIKEDHSPVTALDLLCSKILEEKLPQIIDIPVLSEENVESFVGEGDSFWLVDPIDGTKELLKGTGEWTINIALIKAGEVIWAGVSAPALKEIFVGDCLQRKCWFYKNGSESIIKRKEQSLDVWKNEVPCRILASVSHPENDLSSWLEEEVPNSIIINAGSSLKFCRLAQGLGDLYPRFVQLKIWDIAAGHGILKAAGGNVWYDFGAKEVRYSLRNLNSPRFLAF